MTARERIARFLTDQIRQGLSPHEIAVTVAVGLCCSVPPVIGVTTILCTLAAVRLRLNQPLIQAVNVLAYPLQLLLLVPFLRAGEWLFQAPHVALSPAKIAQLGRADLGGAIRALWIVTWHGAVVWAIVSPPAGYAVYRLLRPFLVRLAARARRPAGV